MKKGQSSAILCLLVFCGGTILVHLFSLFFAPTIVSATIPMMSTMVRQKVYAGSQKEGERVLDDVFDMLRSFESDFSLYLPDSEISKINKEAGKAYVTVSSRTYELLKQSVAYAAVSENTFDITIGPVTLLWDISSENPHIPTEMEQESAASLVDYRKIFFDDETKSVKLEKEGMILDLGAIAKGAACDEARHIYQNAGIRGAWLSIGGNILTYGRPEKGNLFSVEIQDRTVPSQTFLGTLDSSGDIIASSGGYERFFQENGQTYIHIFNPQTGMPLSADWSGVTVISEDGAYSDYLSTYLFGLKKDRLLEIWKNSFSLDYAFIATDLDGNVYISALAESYFHPVSPEKRSFYLASGKGDCNEN